MLNKLIITEELKNDFTALCKSLIEDREENHNFLLNPDDSLEHVPRWHKYGILTHSFKFLTHYQDDILEQIKNEDYYKNIILHLKNNIDDKNLDTLIQIVIILHDIGKFKRHFVTFKGKLSPNYKDHEKISKELILNHNGVKAFIDSYFSLTNDQVEYVADCAGLHYELGKVRRKLKRSHGFTENLICTDWIKDELIEIILIYPKYKIEIGLLFLGDSMAKGIKNEEQRINILLAKEYFANMF